MALHPHDTDRILGVLGDAIEKLREAHYGYSRTGAQEVANDLALLHGAVSAEAEQHEQKLDAQIAGLRAYAGRDIDVKRSEAGRRRVLRAVKDEEIQAEVDRGEHRDD